MPRNISFALTTDQIRNRTKTVTRRLGWKFLASGDVLNACVKCQGLKPGEKIQRLGQVRVANVNQEPLNDMTTEPLYGRDECRREGFPDMEPHEFVSMFCNAMKCRPEDDITRIEFEYVD
jgi:hypothetical protein|tara:strand:- start:336 stop:695 length:360 start_codon:yes stop_codon:yes gene_type:complete